MPDISQTEIEQFLSSDSQGICIGVDDPQTPKLVFPGSFNPLHEGHVGMANYASELSQTPVAFEISVSNVDKPDLTAAALLKRARQFASFQNDVWLTKAPTFSMKADIFPRATFVLGADTMRRLIDPAYYQGEEAFIAAVNQISAAGCKLLAFGRLIDGTFLDSTQFPMPETLKSIIHFIPEQEFRCDISSTDIRDQNADLN